MRHALPAVSILALMMAWSPVLAQETAPNIDAARMNESVRILASDDFEGRAPASAGEEKTVAWLVEQFKAAGAEGGGPDGAPHRGFPPADQLTEYNYPTGCTSRVL